MRQGNSGRKRKKLRVRITVRLSSGMKAWLSSTNSFWPSPANAKGELPCHSLALQTARTVSRYWWCFQWIVVECALSERRYICPWMWFLYIFLCILHFTPPLSRQCRLTTCPQEQGKSLTTCSKQKQDKKIVWSKTA